MKIIVTHTSPDWDAITSAWLIKRFLNGWEDAAVQFVSAGERLAPLKNNHTVIEQIDKNEVMHVDTGMGPLDHHQTPDRSVCGASLTWEFVKLIESERFRPKADDPNESVSIWNSKAEAIERIVKVVVALDHFQEVFWPEADADYQEFSLLGLLEGLKDQYPDSDGLYVEKASEWLDAMLHNFEARVWAEKELTEKAIEFETKFGKGLALESLNDTVIKLAQKRGYVLVIRKDPRKGYVRIKARPERALDTKNKAKNDDIDLTLIYEKLKKMDPEANWFLHVSKKMLLNGGSKSPNMKATILSLDQIVKVVEKI